MSNYLYGIHDKETPEWVLNGKGYIVDVVALGHDEHDQSTVSWLRPETLLCRLQHGWSGEGTLPPEQLLPVYLKRVQNFVRNSTGVRHWIAFNEPNHSQERWRGQAIGPAYAAQCYLAIRTTILSLPGHEQDLVLVGAIAPWNQESGDWLEYMRVMYRHIGGEVDAVALHAYTHGADPMLIESNEHQHGWYWHFRTYRQQILEGLSEEARGKPIYITETNQNEPWVNVNSGWVQGAYEEIDNWNKAGNPTIRALILYRWAWDRWALGDKPGVLTDLRYAQEQEYTWLNSPSLPEAHMLKNPRLEPPFTARQDSNILIARDWHFDFFQPDHPSGKRPECGPETRDVGAGRVLEGSTAQKVFWTFGIGQAWLWQIAHELEPGKWYEFTAYVYVWSSEEDNPNQSTQSGKVWARLGVHPWGVADAHDFGTEYGGAIVDQYDKWIELSTVFMARSSDVAVFLWASPEWAVKHNDVYWDKVALAEWECVAAPPEPPEPSPQPECYALNYEETVAAVKEGVQDVLDSATFGVK